MTTRVPANPPRRHHFLPECYQRLWAGADGMVERFGVEHGGELRARRLPPGSVGWAHDLYRIPGEDDPWAAQRIETEFFAKLDAEAATVMRGMVETGRPPSTGEARSAWASFLLAFMHRTPEHLDATLGVVTEMNAELMVEAEQRYADLRGPHDPPTFAEWETLRAAHAVERSMLKTVMDLISSPKAGPYMINMKWAVLDLTAGGVPLMVGDNPIILVPLKLPDGHVALPLGPGRLFMASEDPRLVNAVQAASPRQTAKLVNRLMVERANRVVIASDRSQEAFVRKRFGTCRIGSLATGLHQPGRPA